MKIDLKTILTFLTGALVCYGYFFLYNSLYQARSQGQLEVLTALCKPELAALQAPKAPEGAKTK